MLFGLLLYSYFISGIYGYFLWRILFLAQLLKLYLYSTNAEWVIIFTQSWIRMDVLLCVTLLAAWIWEYHRYKKQKVVVWSFIVATMASALLIWTCYWQKSLVLGASTVTFAITTYA